jgi:hypothetical protein
MLILLRGSLLQAASFLFFILLFAAFVRQSKARARPPAHAVDAIRPAWTAGHQRMKYADA